MLHQGAYASSSAFDTLSDAAATAAHTLTVCMACQAMRAAMDVLYNATADVPCYNVGDLVGPAGPGRIWLYQWCTERMAQELPYFTANGQTDMFWDQGDGIRFCSR